MDNNNNNNNNNIHICIAPYGRNFRGWMIRVVQSKEEEVIEDNVETFVQT